MNDKKNVNRYANYFDNALMYCDAGGKLLPIFVIAMGLGIASTMYSKTTQLVDVPFSGKLIVSFLIVQQSNPWDI